MPSRRDNVFDPDLAHTLLLARRGTAYFSRLLGRLTDAEFDGPTLLPGWSRRHLVAHVGYNARALTRLIEWARTGIETPMYASTSARAAEIDIGATLNPTALRNLHHHAAVTLNVEWRDLPTDRWDAVVRTAQGRTVPASDTVWMRTREVWLHAIDLDNGGRFADLPDDLVDRLLADVTVSWRRREVDAGYLLRPTDRSAVVLGSPDAPGEPRREIAGTAVELLRWATGRGPASVTDAEGEVGAAPRWL